MSGEIANHDSTPGLSDEDLLRRAVRGARSHSSRGYQPRYVAVRDCFALGMTFSRGLCLRFGFDPDELVRR